MFKVNIQKSGENHIATAFGGKFFICKFERSMVSGGWYFRKFNNDCITFVDSQVFPFDYFIQLCQAVFVAEGLCTEFPKIELTAAAQKLLKKYEKEV